MSEQDFIAAILGAARIDEYEGKVFSIGPFGIRVGFAYQQERALNLVYCLVKDGRVSPTHRVLIVGGGLAGVTAKIALHGMGVRDAWLFEKRDDLFKMQHGAQHRNIHPCYNNWPIADYFSPTSNFPFLNWFSSSAASVVAFLNKRWLEIYSPRLTRVRTGHFLKSLDLTSEDPATQRVKATFERADASEFSMVFDRAILATGFGNESDLEHSSIPSYWTPDIVDVVREDEQNKSKIYVSGIGDGGLMDFIRMGFRRDPDCDLALETISHLRHSRYADPLTSLTQSRHEPSAVESAIREIEKAAALLLPQSPLPRSEFGDALENRIAQQLSEGYASIVQNLPSACEEFLSKRLHPKIFSSGKLHLIGRLAAPFTCATAPINKVLVAYLLNKNQGLYQRGYVDIEKRQLVPSTGRRVSLKKSFVILRHGAQPPVFRISTKFAEQNRSLNRAMADLAKYVRPDEALCSDLHDIVSMSSVSRTNVAYRWKLARAFASRCMGLTVSPQINQQSEVDAFWFEFNPRNIEDIDSISRRFGGFPHEIFGVKLLAKEPQEADLGLG